MIGTPTAKRILPHSTLIQDCGEDSGIYALFTVSREDGTGGAHPKKDWCLPVLGRPGTVV